VFLSYLEVSSQNRASQALIEHIIKIHTILGSSKNAVSDSTSLG
jgi:hypothetical protein